MADSPDAFCALLVAGQWRGAQHTCAVLSRIERCQQQLRNVANVARHLESCSRRIPGVNGCAMLTRQREGEGVGGECMSGVVFVLAVGMFGWRGTFLEVASSLGARL